MKIDDTHQILKNLYPERKTDSKNAVGERFGDVLRKTIGSKGQQAAGPPSAAFVNPPAGIQPRVNVELDRRGAVDRLENLVDLLDHYRQQLSDPRITLKKIDPIIKEIENQSEMLAPVLDSLPGGEKLKDILNETLVTASLEVTRFYRGDYIPQ